MRPLPRHIPGLFLASLLLAAPMALCAEEPFVPDASDASPGAAPSTLPTSNPSKSGAFDGGEDSPELSLFKDIPVVVAAGKRQQTILEAPASVTVIDANDIQLSHYDSLAAALRNQRGFFIETDGLNWFVGERGFLRPSEWNARILVTVDGRPTNEMIYGQSHIDRDFVVPMEAVKQVEIVRGPGSALYGTNAVFGVINVVTKDGADINGAQVSVEGGDKETGRVAALMGMQFNNGWDVVASATGYTSHGDGDIIYDGVTDQAHNYGHIRNFDHEGVESIFVKARKGDLTLQVDYETRTKQNRSATYLASFYDPGTMHEQRGNFTLKYDHAFDAQRSVHSILYWGHYGYQQDFGLAPVPPTPFHVYTTTANDEWLGQEVHYDWQATQQLHLLAGADGREALFTHQHDYDSLQGEILNVDASDNYWGLFTEGEYRLTTWLDLTGGLRLDEVQRVGLHFSPRFAAVFSPTSEDAIKLLYGRAFRAPNLYELLYAAPAANTPNIHLHSEVVDTYEAAWERQLDGGWHTSLDGFVWKLKHAMENDVLADGSLETVNGPTVWAHGIEAEIGRKWDSGANARIYGTFTRAEHDGDRLLNSPEWTIGMSLVAPIYKSHTFISIEPQIVGPMKDDLGFSTNVTYATNIVLTSRDILPGWDAQAGVYNLFANHARWPRGADLQSQQTLNYPDASYIVSLTHRF